MVTHAAWFLGENTLCGDPILPESRTVPVSRAEDVDCPGCSSVIERIPKCGRVDQTRERLA